MAKNAEADYSNGKIYKIVNSRDDAFYVGSTIQELSARFAQHRNSQNNAKLQKHMRKIGWKNSKIILLELYPCNSKKELIMREQHFIDVLKPNLNSMSSYKFERAIEIEEEIAGITAMQESGFLDLMDQHFESLNNWSGFERNMSVNELLHEYKYESGFNYEDRNNIDQHILSITNDNKNNNHLRKIHGAQGSRVTSKKARKSKYIRRYV